jgi:hypothetical protein
LGVLYSTVKLSQDAEKQSMISDLLALGITESKEGINIHDLNYYEVRHELVLAEIRKRDKENPENK